MRLFSIAVLPLLRTPEAWESLGGGGCSACTVVYCYSGPGLF